MEILAVDMGSYSVKIIEFSLERKQLTLLHHHEFPLDEARTHAGSEISNRELQRGILKNFIGEGREAKMVMQIPAEMITTRYLSLPVTNRKKLELMLPFQLDDNLPFPSSEAHFLKSVEKKGENSAVTLNITKYDEFEEFYNQLDNSGIMPSILTSEHAVLSTYLKNKKPQGNVMVVDIGHDTAKAYVIRDGEIVANHINHTAGKVIDDVIATTYRLPVQEAVIYKHQNCFFLTEAQYQEVNAEQQEFAKLMKQAISPLVQDLKRWEIGFRLKHGHPIDMIYLTGGTSRINNIANFLSQAIGIKVDFLPIPESIVEKDDSIGNASGSLTFACLMGQCLTYKEPLANFLSGAFSGKLGQGLPLYSVSYIAARALAFSAILSSLLLIERYAFLNPEIRSVNSKVQRILKGEVSGLSARDKREYSARPERVEDLLVKRQKVIEQQLSSIMSAASINAVSPLSRLANAVGDNSNVTLVSFESDGKFSKAIFEAVDAKELAPLQQKLRAAGLAALIIEPGASETMMNISFQEH
jgi:Tfp pilus assembly PilM family ATPase